jgi:hypothetical protein
MSMKRRFVFFAALTVLALGGCASPVSDAGNNENTRTSTEGRAPLTAQVSFAQTGNNSADLRFDVDGWTVEEGAEQWRLAVVEQGSVSFAVRKAPGQSISVGGPAAERVSPEEEADGSVAGEDFALFTVDTVRILDGGELAFVLTVSEAERESRTVGVRLEVEADLSRGVGVFFVEEDGRLVRIIPENAEDYANEFYLRDREADFGYEFGNGPSKWRINFADVDTLFEALTWVDQYAQSGVAERYQEYRIRVEKDEAMIRTVLSCGRTVNQPTTFRADYVRFALRGHGQERTITKVPGNNAEYSIVSASDGNGFITVGFGPKHIALRLGENITIDAQRELYPGKPGTGSSNGGWEHWIIEVAERGIVTMEKGSTLANHSGLAVWVPSVSQYIDGAYSSEAGLFELKGGTIRNCSIAVDLAQEYTNVLGYTTKTFRFHSGSIVNNSARSTPGKYDNLIGIAQGYTQATGTIFAYLPYTYFAVDG